MNQLPPAPTTTTASPVDVSMEDIIASDDDDDGDDGDEDDGADDDGTVPAHPPRRGRHSESRLRGAVEILPGRLYYAPLRFFPMDGDDDDDDGDGYGGGGGPAERKKNSAATSAASAPASASGGGGGKRRPIHYFSIDGELVYWNFFLDFGPLNLGQLYRFCRLLNAKLSSVELRDRVVCFYSGIKGSQRANAIYLMCAWSMMYLGRTLDESYHGFEDEEEMEEGGGRGRDAPRVVVGSNASLPPWSTTRGERRRRRQPPTPSGRRRRPPGGSILQRQEEEEEEEQSSSSHYSPFASLHPLPPYHDASPVECTYDLSVRDCLAGLDRARRLGFFRFGNAPPPPPPLPSSPPHATASPPPAFDIDEYEHFEQVENGDLNWIVAGRILAFAGPQSRRLTTPEGYCVLSPEDYAPYFRSRNVSLVVQLNRGGYDGARFSAFGIRHVSRQYPDGSCPEPDVLRSVLADMEGVPGGSAFAVHCKAGLGRTGTCIGAYLMKHFRFTAREAIGYMRVCRPGMVIGPQQHFLEGIERSMWQEGDAWRAGVRVWVGGGGSAAAAAAAAGSGGGAR